VSAGLHDTGFAGRAPRLLKLLFATLGTLGDVRPALAIAVAAAHRGHRIKFACSESFTSLVERHGLECANLGSDAYLADSSARRGLIEPSTGFALFMALSNLQSIESMFLRLEELADDVDAIVSTPFVMAAHLVAQRRQLPLVNCATSPAVLLAQWGAGVTDPYSAEWRSRLNALRNSAGLPRRSFPQMERFSGDLALGIYPNCLTATEGPFIRTPVEVGYPSLEDLGGRRDKPSDDLQEWMADGRCVMVSFGSFVDHRAAHIFDSAQRACASLGLKLLFVSHYRADELARHQSADVRVERFVPHRPVMERAAVVVHHCGVGTLAAAAASRRPMILVPFGLDQPYNADVVSRRGLADVLPAEDISYETFRAALIDAIDRWPQRKLAWQTWLDDGGRPAYGAVDQIEAIVARRMQATPSGKTA